MSRRSRRANCQCGMRGKTNAGQKGSEKGMNADLVGGGSRKEARPATTTPSNSRLSSGLVRRRATYAPNGLITASITTR